MRTDLAEPEVIELSQSFDLDPHMLLLEPGEYAAFVFGMNPGSLSGALTFSVADAGELARIEIPLLPSAVVAVEVLDATTRQRPDGGALVFVLKHVVRGTAVRLAEVSSPRLNAEVREQGVAERSLPPGHFQLTVSQWGLSGHEGSVDLDIGPGERRSLQLVLDQK